MYPAIRLYSVSRGEQKAFDWCCLVGEGDGIWATQWEFIVVYNTWTDK